MEQMPGDTESELVDLSDSNDTTLEQVLNTLCMRYTIQDTLPGRPNPADPNIGVVCMANFMTNFLILGQYLPEDQKKLYVQVLECMSIVEPQGDYKLINKVLGLNIKP